ncbi:MAG: hypothetical protein Q9160_002849 [Pyrenula sp. 1 TL-2023]
MAESIADVLTSPLAQNLLGHDARIDGGQIPFLLDVITRLEFLLHNPSKRQPLFEIGVAALDAFTQANVTGPPLKFNSTEVIFPRRYLGQDELGPLLEVMRNSLVVEGEPVYTLTPHIELFWLAKQILNQKDLGGGSSITLARARANFTHHRLVLDRASSNSLQKQILLDYESLEPTLRSKGVEQEHGLEGLVSFYVERAAVYTYFELDTKAREDLTQAADINWFDFRLTGWLGKRTRFQDRDISQLIVLAKSSVTKWKPNTINKDILGTREGLEKLPDRTEPINLDLNDDTLLESISFAKTPTANPNLPEIHDISDLPISLKSIDPASQPKLQPLDAIILLNLASSISNTRPQDGLTREETLPYATRVLEGRSSNWQIYTQALLIRSRIEGYKSRTAQRGLLQLQAVVDQVIAETTGVASAAGTESEAATTPDTFLPKPKPGESAPVSERLKYVWQLNRAMRWELEAELAARWVQMGGLRTALDIYRRLHMKAELALCLAATDQEEEAIRVIRETLFEPDATETDKPEAEIMFYGARKQSLPTDAPRLLCILGDLEKDPDHYQMAWSVSNRRYARAQRSLGRYYMQEKTYFIASEAYRAALRVSPLDAPTWFALGCIELELQEWFDAVEAFTRAVRIEDQDAEAWSNLAVALLKLPPDDQPRPPPSHPSEDEAKATATTKPRPLSSSSSSSAPPNPDPNPNPNPDDPLRNLKSALHALRRAAALSPSSSRIWDNYLTVSASIPPPSTPYNDIILAQRRVIELRGKSIGDAAVDEAVLRMLVRHVTASAASWEGIPPARTAPTDSMGARDGKGEEAEGQASMKLPREMKAQARNLIALVEECVRPIVTRNEALWGLVAELEEWRGRNWGALEAEERLWRGVVNSGDGGGGGGGKAEGEGGFETEEGWDGVVEGTVRLVRAYERLGPKWREQEEEKKEGGKENEDVGNTGEKERELVAKDWKFKARSALRSVKGRGKENWEGSDGWRRLEECLEGLRGN